MAKSSILLLANRMIFVDFFSIFKFIFACFGGSFFNVFLRSYLAPFCAPGRLFKLTPKSRKTHAKPKSVQEPSRGRFWNHFGNNFGVILWELFGIILAAFWYIFRKYIQNICKYVQIRANVVKYAQMPAELAENRLKLHEFLEQIWRKQASGFKIA